MIPVTKTYLPNIKKYQEYVERIFASNQLTNNGTLVRELESKLKDYLGVPYLVLVSNGTLALQLAYKLLELKGDVITTPFSFVATTSSLIWGGLKPVFSDINPETLNIDVTKIEEKVTKDTSCILPVHVFGNPCEVDRIQKIADRHNLKVIYDAAHAFGTDYKGKSIFNFGDVSIVSFHATKLFHTIEGGAIIMQNEELYKKAKQLINFGFGSNGIPEVLGINAKMNEFQAAMGLCVLDDIDIIHSKREQVHKYYQDRLGSISDIDLVSFNQLGTKNYSYFPIILKNEEIVVRVKEALEEQEIFPRRYFYPSLDGLPFVDSPPMEVAGEMANRILCLPMYGELSKSIIDEICHIIINQITSMVKENECVK